MSIRRRKANKTTMAVKADAINKAVGKRIRAKRLNFPSPLSMEAVGDHLGRTIATVSRLESGATSAEPPVLIALAKLFGCKPSDFLDGIEV